MHESDVHNTNVSNPVIYADDVQTLPGENHKIIFKIKVVNGENKLVMKAKK